MDNFSRALLKGAIESIVGREPPHGLWWTIELAAGGPAPMLVVAIDGGPEEYRQELPIGTDAQIEDVYLRIDNVADALEARAMSRKGRAARADFEFSAN